MAILILFSVPTHAQLAWAQRENSLQASPPATEIRAEFAFTNTGDQSVTIINIKPSCGCTTATLERKTYQPGESSVVVVNFEFGDRLGKQLKTIRVTSEHDGPDGKPNRNTTTLILRVNIPEILRPQPSFLNWRVGEPRIEKHIDLRVMWSGPVKIKSVTTEGDPVKTRVEYLEKDRRYRLHVTPSPGDAEAKTKLIIKTDFPSESPRTYTLYARAMGIKEK